VGADTIRSASDFFSNAVGIRLDALAVVLTLLRRHACPSLAAKSPLPTFDALRTMRAARRPGHAGAAVAPQGQTSRLPARQRAWCWGSRGHFSANAHFSHHGVGGGAMMNSEQVDGI
jgi:hypothetical protein